MLPQSPERPRFRRRRSESAQRLVRIPSHQPDLILVPSPAVALWTAARTLHTVRLAFPHCTISTKPSFTAIHHHYPTPFPVCPQPAFRTAPSAGLGMSGTLASQLNALHAAADREMESLAKGLHSAAAARTGPLAPYGAHPRLDLDRAGAETPTGRLGDMDERGMATAMGHMASTIGRAAESADSPHRPRNARGAVAPRVGVVARDSPRASRSDRSTAATTARTGATTRARRVRLQHRRPDGGARTRCWRAVRAWKRRWGARGGS